VIRTQIVEVGEGAGEVRGGAGLVQRHLVGARRELAAQADVAAAARVEVGVSDAITLVERLTKGIGPDVRAELVDVPGHLVSGGNVEARWYFAAPGC